MSIPILDNDGIEREIASDLTADGEVQRVSVPGVATAAKQDTAKEVLDAILAALASVPVLDSIDGKQPALVNNRVPVVLTTVGGVAVEPIIEPAHDAPDDANGPAKIGGRASTSLPAAVADGDRVNAYFDAHGQLHVVLGEGTAQVGHVGHGKTLKQVVVAPSAAGDNTAIAQVSGKKLTVYGLVITTKDDVSAGLTIKFTDGVSGTTLWEADAMVPATQSWGVSEAVSPPGHLFQGSASTALVVNLSAAKACKVSLAYWEE